MFNLGGQKKDPILVDLQASFPRTSKVSSVGHSLEVRHANPVAFE